MFGSESLDVLIGLIAVYLSFSLAVTAISVAILGWLSLRGRYLKLALKQILAGETGAGGFYDAFAKHPLIVSLCKGDKGFPSYIPKETFSQVVTAILAARPVLTSIGEAIAAFVESGDVKTLLEKAWSDAQSDDAKFDAAIGASYLAARDNLRSGIPFSVAFYNAIQSDPDVVKASKNDKDETLPPPSDVVGKAIRNWLLNKQTVNLIGAAIASLPPTADSTDQNAPKNRIKELLQTLYAEANGDLQQFRAALEKHFDAVMDRATGWFKRWQVAWTLVISIVLVGLGNVDTVAITKTLATDKDTRTKMVDYAIAISNHTPVAAPAEGKNAFIDPLDLSGAATKATKKSFADLSSAGLILGWSAEVFPPSPERYCGYLISKVSGLLVSALAISLGAPFWFDMLQKVIQIRSALKPEEKKPEEKKKS